MHTSSKLNTFKIGLYFLIIILLILGIFFRFVNLDRKVYWLDETHTSLRIFGYTEPEFIEDIFAGEVVTAKDLLKYQRPSPEKNWSDTFRIVSGNTEHAPLYYFSLRLWTQLFGSSIAVTRSLSAVISLFAFPAIYWLSQELFASPLVGWMAIALISVSPFHILYAQEARPYSLLTVIILLSSAALLRAVRVKSNLSWSIYAVTLAIGLYTHWFFAVVAFSHGVYLILTEKFRPNKNIVAYLLASLAAIITFSPWIINTITAPPPLKEQMGWVFKRLPLLTLFKAWLLNISRIFFDFDRGFCLPFANKDCHYIFGYDSILIYVFIIPIVILVAYSLYYLYCNTPTRVWLFIITLIGVMALALVLPDIVKGGQRSTVNRYLIPCWLGIQLAIAYCFASKSLGNKLWQIIAIILLSLGVISSAISSQAYGWWSKGGNYHVYPIANIINQTERPLLLYSIPNHVLWGKGGAVGRVMPLSRLLEPKVGILFVVAPNVPEKLPSNFSQLFLYRPHQELKQWLQKEHNYQVKTVENLPGKQTRLWTVVKE